MTLAYINLPTSNNAYNQRKNLDETSRLCGNGKTVSKFFEIFLTSQKFSTTFSLIMISNELHA